MESMNKFKVLTVMIIGVFVFAIAAMYVNTKDVTEQKAQENSAYEQKEDDYEINSRRESEISNIMYSVNRLERKVSELSQKVEKNDRTPKTSESKQGEMRCRMLGTRSNGEIIQLPPEAVLQDARVNGRDIIVSCSLK